MQGKRRGVALNKRRYRHLSFQTTRHGKEAIFYRYQGRNVRIWSDPETQPVEFETEYDEAVAAKVKDRPGRVRLTSKAGTWNAALDDFVEDADYPKGKSTQRNYDRWIEVLRVALGDKMMRATSRRLIYDMHNQLVKSNQPIYANILRRVLRGAVRQARISEWLKDDNLIWGIELQPVESVHYQPYPEDQVARWRAAYTPETDLMAWATFELAYNCAFATAELCRFAPCHIADNGEYAIQRKKRMRAGKVIEGGFQRGNIYSNPTLAAVIAALRALPPTGEDVIDFATGKSSVPFLRNQYGEPYSDEGGGLRKFWRDRREAIGLPASFVIHSGRATLVTLMQDEGVAINDGMQKTGHDKAETYIKSYGHAANRQRAAARADEKINAKRGKAGLREVS